MPNTRINRAALTTRLSAMVEFGILERDPPEGRRAEYRLTEAGRELAPLLEIMRDWGDKWLLDERARRH